MENKYAHSDFDSFYLEYSPKLWRLAYRLTRNRYDSEDLVDEAFLIYLQKSITMVIDNPEAYITRILANLVRNYARLYRYVPTLLFRFIELEIIMHCSSRAEIANWLCAPGANSTLHTTIFCSV